MSFKIRAAATAAGRRPQVTKAPEVKKTVGLADPVAAARRREDA